MEEQKRYKKQKINSDKHKKLDRTVKLAKRTGAFVLTCTVAALNKENLKKALSVAKTVLKK